MSREQAPQVVVVGSCMIDLVSYVERLPRPGETVHGSSFVQGFGGKGANQCVMAAKLGAQAAMVAKVGDDSFGHSTLKNFKDNHINTDHVTMSPKAPSGVAPITVNENGENAIVIVSGANLLLDESDVQKAEALISQAKVVLCQLEVPLATSQAALVMAKKHRAISILNVAPGVATLSTEFFNAIDILCLNETEAELLTGWPVTDLGSAREAVRMLQSKGPGCVVLTLGEKGIIFSQRDTSDIKHIEAPTVNVVDTTGAGDAFVGALGYYLACHAELSFEEKARRAAIIASYTVTEKGTQTSYMVEKLPKSLFDSV